MEYKNSLGKVSDAILENGNGREIVMYGRHTDIQNKLQEAGYPIEKIFTGNVNLLENESLGCIPLVEMKGNSKKYYAVLPFFLPDGGKLQRNIMKRFGYEETKDYIFYPITKYDVSKDGICDYADEHGNVIVCRNEKIKIRIKNGKNNRITIGKIDTLMGNLTISVTGSNTTIDIGDHCQFNQNNLILSNENTNIIISKNCRFSSIKISCASNTDLQIEEACTFNSRCLLYIHSFSKLLIEKDAMFSYDIILQTGDGHSIFDLETRKNINSDPDKIKRGEYLSEIHLGEHVWVGRSATLLSGLRKTEIGEGSIIGARSLVKGRFPNNCILAGVPARVIRKNIAWSRKNNSDDIADCGPYIHPTEDLEK